MTATETKTQQTHGEQEETVESVDGNEYTFAEWLRAVGNWQAQDPSMLRQAWRAGEDPADYRR